MEVLSYLIPISLSLGALGLAGFFWMVKTRQFDDPEGDSHRILSEEFDDKPRQN
jgi:cbb3-type cytochrome oxidase maturation protein